MSPPISADISRVRPRTLRPHEVRAARKALKMTQTAFGDALGRTRASVHNWEAGRVEVPLIVTRAIALLLKSKRVKMPVA